MIMCRKELRKARFGSGKANEMSTSEAKKKLEEDLKKKIERAKKFGTPVKELEEIK